MPSDGPRLLCLAVIKHDPDCTLAFVSSICLLFCVVGLIGLKTPQPKVRPLGEFGEIVPVVFTPPDQPPPQQTDQPQEQPEDTRDAPLDAPVIATVVAADPGAVKFAVPVSGPVILAPARFASAPPPQVKVPPAAPTRFVPTGKEAGTYPWPREYPRQALQQRQEGTVMLLVSVAEDGAPGSVTVKDSSGYTVLDRFAAEWVRDNWKWPAGQLRRYYVPFKFRLQR